MVSRVDDAFLKKSLERGIKSLSVKSGKYKLIDNPQLVPIFVDALILDFCHEPYFQVMHFLLTVDIKFYGELSMAEIKDKYYEVSADQWLSVNASNDKHGVREVNELAAISKTLEVIETKRIKK